MPGYKYYQKCCVLGRVRRQNEPDPWLSQPDSMFGEDTLNISTYPRAYAPAPCAAACNPFKNSPGTYATWCKQHAATVAARKAPVPPPGFRTTVVKSKLPKPLTTGQLHQGQVKKVVGTLDTERGMRTPLKQLDDALNGVTSPLTFIAIIGQHGLWSNLWSGSAT